MSPSLISLFFSASLYACVIHGIGFGFGCFHSNALGSEIMAFSPILHTPTANSFISR